MNAVLEQPQSTNARRPAVNIETVTPESADNWLSRYNTKNRPVVKSNIENIRQEIVGGRWRSDHPAPIVFDVNGTLIDGQHRLMAIAASGASVRCYVMRNAAPDLRDVIDTGKSRKLSDRVFLHESPTLNAFMTQIAKHLGDKVSDTSMCTGDIRDIHAKYGDSLEWAASWMNTKRQRGIHISPVAAALAKLHRVNPAVAEACAESLVTPDGAVQPMRILRDYLLTRNGYTGSAKTVTDTHCRAITAMNAALAGRDVKQLKASQRPVIG